MKNLRNCIAALLLCGTTILLSSCAAFSEFEQLGLMGWLDLGSAITETPAPPTKVTPSAVPSLLPTMTPAATPTAPELTSLPEIPKSPAMTEVLASLPERDLSGAHVMLSYTGSPLMLGGRQSEDIIPLINGLEKKYSCGSTLFNQRSAKELGELIGSGEYFADLLLIPIEDAISYARQDLLLPIPKDKISLDVNGAYYTNACRGFTENEEIYFLLPSAETPYESSVVIYCNTDLLSRLVKDKDIAADTKKGLLTFELLCSYLRLAAKEMDGGYTLADTAFTPEELESFLKYGLSLENDLEDADYFINNCRFSDTDDAIADFFDGKTLFYIGLTEELRNFRESSDSFCILPIPKAQSSEGDYPIIYDSSRLFVFAIPKSALNTDAALALADGIALCARSQLRFEFIESLYSSYIRNRDSIIYTGVSRFDGEITLPKSTGTDPSEDDNDSV